MHLALQAQLPDGYHAQSNKPRDPTLIPTTLKIAAPAGVTVTEVVFPATVESTVPGFNEPLAVFEREFTIGVTLTVAKGAHAGDLDLPATLRYQACNATTCFSPKTETTAWTLHVVPTATAVRATHADVFKPIAFGHGDAPANAAAAAPPVPVSAAPAAGAASPTDVLATFDRFEVRSSDPGGYMTAPEFVDFVHRAERGEKSEGMFAGHGPLAILLLVFIGGAALNLTPCVLPMIPINLAIIGAGAQSAKKSRGFLLGATYGAAMAVVYGVLGVIVILTAGTFGTINASPWFNLGIAVLFVVLALAMFDVIEIDFSRFSSNIRFGQESRGTFYLAFAMGAVAALLAGACVAPVVIQVVLFSSNLYATGTKIALALPFLLGLGMAIPWPIAGAGLAALPKPGMWMVRVKQVFGVFILLTAAYYGYEAYSLFANRWVDPASVRASVDAQLKEGWNPSIAEGLDNALKTGQPVLIDMWASWCKNCLVMDQTTLKDPSVKSALANYVKIKFEAEDLDASPAREILQRVRGVGLPAYIVLQPKPGGAR